MSSENVPRGGKERTDRSLPLRVMLFRDVMGTLILKIRCTDVSIRMEIVSHEAYFHR